MFNCAGVSGLAGVLRTRLTWPYRPFIETVFPRLPDCEISDILIRYFLSLVVLLVDVKRRAWPSRPTNLGAPKLGCIVISSRSTTGIGALRAKLVEGRELLVDGSRLAGMRAVDWAVTALGGWDCSTLEPAGTV